MSTEIQTKKRESGLELFRILTMVLIVSHHYFANSGLNGELYKELRLSFNSVFLLLFGWGGKTGINCFVLITGYFMCKSKITVRKYLKLILEVWFYKVIIFLIFLITGYQKFSARAMIKALLPIISISDAFVSAYLLFYLFIPFFNILTENMNKKQHLLLIVLCTGVYTILPTMLIPISFNYVSWFTVIYFIGAYLRLYPEKWFSDRRKWAAISIGMLMLSWLSVVVIFAVLTMLRDNGIVEKLLAWNGNLCYYFVSDSNKILALFPAIAFFMFFANSRIKYSAIINKIAASTFGVLLIHANSDAMRRWLWRDTLKNVEFFSSKLLFAHAIISVIAIYVVCTCIDMLRIKYPEKQFFKWYDKKYGGK